MSSFEDFKLQCNVYLHSIVKKKHNIDTIANILWKFSNKDYTYANYLCFEIISEYFCSFKTLPMFINIKNKNLGWNHETFKIYQSKQKEFDDFLTNPPEVQEGVIECNACGSKKTFSFSKQTRRADESATVFVRCSNCNKTFKM